MPSNSSSSFISSILDDNTEILLRVPRNVPIELSFTLIINNSTQQYITLLPHFYLQKHVRDLSTREGKLSGNKNDHISLSPREPTFDHFRAKISHSLSTHSDITPFTEEPHRHHSDLPPATH